MVQEQDKGVFNTDWVDLYNPSKAYDEVFGPPEKEWLKSQTGIQDDEELKKHVLTCQDEAWKARYPAIVSAFRIDSEQFRCCDRFTGTAAFEGSPTSSKSQWVMSRRGLLIL